MRTPKPHKSAATGRGDLLRARAAGVEQAAEALGYVQDPRTQDAGNEEKGGRKHQGRQQLPKQRPVVQGGVTLRTPLRMPRAYAVTHEVGDAKSPDNRLNWHAMPSEEWATHFQANGPHNLVLQPLWPQRSHVRPWLDAVAAGQSSPRIDWRRTTERMAKAETLAQLPRQAHNGLASDVHLLIDGADAFAVFEGDAKVLVGHLLALCGRRLQVWRLRQGPAGPWVPVGAPHAQAPRHLHGSVLLVFSDGGRVSGHAWAWQQAMQTWAHQGAQVQYVFPGLAHEVPRHTSSAACVPTGEPSGTPALSTEDPLALLLQALSVALVVDPPLVRALRQQLLPWASPLLELQLWQHPDLWQESPFRQWRVGKSVNYRRALDASEFWDAMRLESLAKTLLDHHGHLSQAIRDEELINLATLPRLNANGHWGHGLEADLDAAVHRVEALAGTLRAGLTCTDAEATPSTWRAYVCARWERTHGLAEQFHKLHNLHNLHQKLATLHALVAMPAGQTLQHQPPDSPDLDSVAPHVAMAKLWLSQDAHGLWLEPCFSTQDRPSRALLSDLWYASGRWLTLKRGAFVLRTWPLANLRAPQLLLSHAELSEPVQLIYDDGVHVSAVTGRASHQVIHDLRPTQRLSATDNLMQSMEAPLSTVDTPWGKVQLATKIQGMDTHWQLMAPDLYAPKDVKLWVDTSGVGMTIALNIGVDLRLRYIPPGTFLMGSRDGQGSSDEHPQHPVTLTEAFWMADTPCTQALWQAVMGNNPSHFKDAADAPQHPVESVSFSDVTDFLQKLQTFLPDGVVADLPTEAEWEYACRAGTQSVYWWGDVFDPTLANIDHQGVKDWDSTEGTNPVGQFSANPWGLHDMHGNVWEWCRDKQRTYRDVAEIDPVGSSVSSEHVMRGCSWLTKNEDVRAASRDERAVSHKNRTRGFRLLIRSQMHSIFEAFSDDGVPMNPMVVEQK